jgi:hypothetical protein
MFSNDQSWKDNEEAKRLSDIARNARNPKPVRIANVLKNKIIGILMEPEVIDKKKKPSNAALSVSWFAFNFLLFVLDIGTAVTVSMLTNPFYGLLTFLAGFGPTLLYEFLYTRAYATKHQRWIAVGGAVIGAASTLAIGALAAVVNVMKALQILAITSGATMWIEIGMAVGLVVFAGLHVVLFSVYFYIDDGIKRTHTRSQSLAAVETKLDSVKDAKTLVQAGVEAAKEVDSADEENLGEALRIMYKKLTGNDLMTVSSSLEGSALADQLFAKKESDVGLASFRPDETGKG